MNKYYLIRHGNRPNLVGDPQLSELGKKQARFAGKALKDKNINQIYSSLSARAQETAQIIAEEINIKKINIDARLRERFNWGDDPLQSFGKFLIEWKKTTICREYKPHLGDSSQKAGERLKEVIDEIESRSKNENVILVTHGGVIVDFLRNLFEDDYLKSFRPNFLEDGIRECSITILIIDKGNCILKAFDSATRLPRLLKKSFRTR